MSGYESANSVNLTFQQNDEPKGGLTNGQIAAITIGTIFVFFMTMMVYLCVQGSTGNTSMEKRKSLFYKDKGMQPQP